MLSYNEQLDLYGKDRKLSTGVVDGFLVQTRSYIVVLSPEDRMDAIRVGSERQRVNMKSNKIKSWNGGDELNRNNILGALGEKAVIRALGLSCSLLLLPIGGDGGKGDIILPSGRTVSVKMNRKAYPTNWFDYQKPLTLNDDYGVLCCPARFNQDKKPEHMSTLLILGYITKDEYNRKKVPIRVPHGEAEGVYDSMMEPFTSLLAIEKSTV